MTADEIRKSWEDVQGLPDSPIGQEKGWNGLFFTTRYLVEIAAQLAELNALGECYMTTVKKMLGIMEEQVKRHDK